VHCVFTSRIARCTSCFQFCHSGVGCLPAACRFGVSFNLFQGLMSGYCHDLMRRCPGLGEGRRCGFSDAVGRTMRQVRLTAPILELVSEPIRRKWPSELGKQKGHVGAGPRGSDASRQRGMQRNIDIDRIAVFVFCLTKANSTVAYMLATKARRILASARCITQQVQRETRLWTTSVRFCQTSRL
jgi:hypothetical protein